MPARIVRAGLTALVSSSRFQAIADHTRMIVGSAWVIEGFTPADAILELLILDDDGEPILDVSGQYLIGG